MGFDLIDNRHIPVPLEFFEMPTDKIPEFIGGIFRSLDVFPEPVKHLLCLVAEKLNQNIVLIFEI